MKHFNVILFHKFEPANKQHTNHSSLLIPGDLSILMKYLSQGFVVLKMCCLAIHSLENGSK